MQQTILFKVPGRASTSPVVILTGPTFGARSSNHFADARKKLSRALSSSWSAAKAYICAPGRLITAATAICVMTAVFSAFILSATGLPAARTTLAAAVILGFPLSIAGAFNPKAKKGGEA